MHPDPDHLPMICHQHQLVFLDNREACHDLAIAVARLDIGDPLAATACLAVIAYGCPFAITVFGH